MSLFCWFDLFLEARAKIHKKISLFFLEDLKTPKGHFEINWPLVWVAVIIRWRRKSLSSRSRESAPPSLWDDRDAPWAKPPEWGGPLLESPRLWSPRFLLSLGRCRDPPPWFLLLSLSLKSKPARCLCESLWPECLFLFVVHSTSFESQIFHKFIWKFRWKIYFLNFCNAAC